MAKSLDIETKYQELAKEYSKERSKATVLKKGLFDEYAKNEQLNETIKRHEQTIRKHDQEMESLTFRNEQLSKRIAVLQQDLQNTTQTKKSRNKSTENISHSDITVLNEELQKKILQNAQLFSSISDKEFELAECKEKIEWLEKKFIEIQNKLEKTENSSREEVEKLRNDKIVLQKKINELSMQKSLANDEIPNCDKNNESEEKIKFWKDEAERCKIECELLKSKPNSNEQLTEYYETQIRALLETKTLALSETKSLLAENLSLNSRLESLILEQSKMESLLEKNMEDLVTTSDNYKAQLDAMTEHLAAQNEKITKQCDEIQILRHKLQNKK